MSQSNCRQILRGALTLSNALGIQTVMTTALVLIAKYTLPLFAVDGRDGRNDSRPFAEDTIFFGLVFYTLTRTIVVSFFSRWKIIINRIVDMFVLLLIIFLAPFLVWILVNQRPLREMVYMVFLPMTFLPILTVPMLVWQPNVKLWSNVLKCVKQYTFYWTVIFINMGFGVFFLAFAGQSNSRDFFTAADVTLSVAVFGIGFPLLRQLSSFLIKKMVRVYEMKLPQDRIQEMTSNLTNFVFIASQDAFWNTLSKFLIMDVRNSVVFYVSLICSLLVTLLVRFSSVAAFRHKNVIRKVFPVTKSPHASADVIKEEVLFTGKSAQENTEETEANEKMLLEAGMVFKSGKMKEIERRITSRTSRRVTLIVVPEDSSRTTEDKVCCARVMIDVDSSRASERLVSEDAVLPQIDVSKEEEILPNYTGSLVQNPTSARRASLPLQNQEHVDHDHGRRDMAYLIADDAGLRDERLRSLAHLLGDPLHHSSDEGEILDTFQPMSEEAVYGFQSVCSIYSEYGARTAATIMTLLLTTTPPQYNWSSCRGSLATENILIRSAISLVAGVVIDVLSVYLDRRFGKVDYARGLEELCELHVSLLALFHLALTTSSVAGLVIFVQPGIFVTDQCFREGRRSWIWKIGTT